MYLRVFRGLPERSLRQLPRFSKRVRRGRRKAKIVPNTFKEARKLTETALWEAAKGTEVHT